MEINGKRKGQACIVTPSLPCHATPHHATPCHYYHLQSQYLVCRGPELGQVAGASRANHVWDLFAACLLHSLIFKKSKGKLRKRAFEWLLSLFSRQRQREREKGVSRASKRTNERTNEQSNERTGERKNERTNECTQHNAARMKPTRFWKNSQNTRFERTSRRAGLVACAVLQFIVLLI